MFKFLKKSIIFEDPEKHEIVIIPIKNIVFLRYGNAPDKEKTLILELSPKLKIVIKEEKSIQEILKMFGYKENKQREFNFLLKAINFFKNLTRRHNENKVKN